jgi:hypothetical protein
VELFAAGGEQGQDFGCRVMVGTGQGVGYAGVEFMALFSVGR